MREVMNKSSTFAHGCEVRDAHPSGRKAGTDRVFAINQSQPTELQKKFRPGGVRKGRSEKRGNEHP